MSAEYTMITTAVGGSTCTLTLNNPARRNAIGALMVNELLWALEAAAQDPSVRTVVLTGAGEHFCAGGDFAQMPVDYRSLPPKGDYADLLVALAEYPKPTIARVNGPARGGGLGLVASCTFAIAHEDVSFGTPEINVGLFPMMIMAVLQRHIPKRQLLEMMLLGEVIPSDKALALGLISRRVKAADLDDAVATLAEKLASKSPSTLRLGLAAYRMQEDLPLTEALPALRARLGECLGTDDAQEGILAFMQKRPPVWKGK
jgi:enoyl-CoA hydratase/carnithine racemase